jgi:16S rRNA (guanine527-N7)-methyltransferase
MPAPLPPCPDAEAFAEITGVSRETIARLEAYAAALHRWQPAINLVGPKTLPDLWSRHMLDSAQLVPLIPHTARRLVDLGSGAGFPGLVLAVMTALEVHLIESDTRKATFLREAARAVGVADRVTIHAKRAEAAVLPGDGTADVITARALAPLETLLPLAARFWVPGTLGLFPKGKRYEQELTAAKYAWYINSRTVPSQTDPEAVILILDRLDPR